jgi:hypothetical protein
MNNSRVWRITGKAMWRAKTYPTLHPRCGGFVQRTQSVLWGVYFVGRH